MQSIDGRATLDGTWILTKLKDTPEFKDLYESLLLHLGTLGGSVLLVDQQSLRIFEDYACISFGVVQSTLAVLVGNDEEIDVDLLHRAEVCFDRIMVFGDEAKARNEFEWHPACNMAHVINHLSKHLPEQSVMCFISNKHSREMLEHNLVDYLDCITVPLVSGVDEESTFPATYWESLLSVCTSMPTHNGLSRTIFEIRNKHVCMKEDYNE